MDILVLVNFRMDCVKLYRRILLHSVLKKIITGHSEGLYFISCQWLPCVTVDVCFLKALTSLVRGSLPLPLHPRAILTCKGNYSHLFDCNCFPFSHLTNFKD